MNFEKMRDTIKQAEITKEKTATMHYLALKHAEELSLYDPEKICKTLKISKNFASEIRKMRAVYNLMKSKNLKL